jgi:outer membrane protein OmpA-like peptidoglycan-associated protein
MRSWLHPLLALPLVLPGVAAAQEGFDAHGFSAPVLDGDPRDPLTIPRAGRVHAGEFWGAALFEVAEDPLVRLLDYPDDRPTVTQQVIDNLVAMNLSAGAAVHQRLRLDLSAPVYLSATGLRSDGTAGSLGAGFGDLRFGSYTAIVLPKPAQNGGFGLGVAPYVVLPTGSPAKFLGNKGLTGGIDVAATFELPMLTFSASAGPRFNPTVAVDNQTGVDQLVAGGAVGVHPVTGLGITLEGRIASALGANAQAGSASPAEVLGHVRYRLDSGLFLLAGGAGAVSGGAGAATWRAFAGAGFGKIELNFSDRDLDGVPNEADQCPDEAETPNAFQDADGCPDDGGRLMLSARIDRIAETDVLMTVAGSGVLERAESQLTPVGVEVPAGTYEVKGVIPGYRAVRSVDVVSGEYPVVLDLEPVVPGYVSIRAYDANMTPLDSVGMSIVGDGAPLDATRRLGVEGIDRFELPPGDFVVFLRSQGVGQFRKRITIEPGEEVMVEAILRDPRAVVRDGRIEILESVFFEVDAAAIKPESYSLLEEVATLLASEDGIELVEVQGHTDAQGSDEHNLELSQRRAEAVREFLIRQGVAGSRLTARGFGETVPIAPNDTVAGRAQNRRVEFRILRTR